MCNTSNHHGVCAARTANIYIYISICNEQENFFKCTCHGVIIMSIRDVQSCYENLHVIASVLYIYATTRKEHFAEELKNLAGYRSENNFVKLLK